MSYILGQADTASGPSQNDIASSVAAGIAAGILTGGNNLLSKAKANGLFEAVSDGFSKMSASNIASISAAANKATNAVNKAAEKGKEVVGAAAGSSGGDGGGKDDKGGDDAKDVPFLIGKSAANAAKNAGPNATPKEITTFAAEAALHTAGVLTGTVPEIVHPEPIVHEYHQHLQMPVIHEPSHHFEEPIHEPSHYFEEPVHEPSHHLEEPVHEPSHVHDHHEHIHHRHRTHRQGHDLYPVQDFGHPILKESGYSHVDHGNGLVTFTNDHGGHRYNVNEDGERHNPAFHGHGISGEQTGHHWHDTDEEHSYDDEPHFDHSHEDNYDMHYSPIFNNPSSGPNPFIPQHNRHLGAFMIDHDRLSTFGKTKNLRADIGIPNPQKNAILPPKSELPEIWGTDTDGNFERIDPAHCKDCVNHSPASDEMAVNTVGQDIGANVGPTINGLPLTQSSAGAKAQVFDLGVPMVGGNEPSKFNGVFDVTANPSNAALQPGFVDQQPASIRNIVNDKFNAEQSSHVTEVDELFEKEKEKSSNHNSDDTETADIEKLPAQNEKVLENVDQILKKEMMELGGTNEHSEDWNHHIYNPPIEHSDFQQHSLVDPSLLNIDGNYKTDYKNYDQRDDEDGKDGASHDSMKQDVLSSDSVSADDMSNRENAYDKGSANSYYPEPEQTNEGSNNGGNYEKEEERFHAVGDGKEINDVMKDLQKGITGPEEDFITKYTSGQSVSKNILKKHLVPHTRNEKHKVYHKRRKRPSEKMSRYVVYGETFPDSLDVQRSSTAPPYTDFIKPGTERQISEEHGTDTKNNSVNESQNGRLESVVKYNNGVPTYNTAQGVDIPGHAMHYRSSLVDIANTEHRNSGSVMEYLNKLLDMGPAAQPTIEALVQAFKTGTPKGYITDTEAARSKEIYTSKLNKLKDALRFMSPNYLRRTLSASEYQYIKRFINTNPEDVYILKVNRYGEQSIKSNSKTQYSDAGRRTSLSPARTLQKSLKEEDPNRRSWYDDFLKYGPEKLEEGGNFGPLNAIKTDEHDLSQSEASNMQSMLDSGEIDQIPNLQGYVKRPKKKPTTKDKKKTKEENRFTFKKLEDALKEMSADNYTVDTANITGDSQSYVDKITPKLDSEYKAVHYNTEGSNRNTEPVPVYDPKSPPVVGKSDSDQTTPEPYIQDKAMEDAVKDPTPPPPPLPTAPPLQEAKEPPAYIPVDTNDNSKQMQVLLAKIKTSNPGLATKAKGGKNDPLVSALLSKLKSLSTASSIKQDPNAADQYVTPSGGVPMGSSASILAGNSVSDSPNSFTLSGNGMDKPALLASGASNSNLNSPSGSTPTGSGPAGSVSTSPASPNGLGSAGSTATESSEPVPKKGGGKVVNSGFPVFNVPLSQSAASIPSQYLKPPPKESPNPYEVLTSDMLFPANYVNRKQTVSGRKEISTSPEVNPFGPNGLHHNFVEQISEKNEAETEKRRLEEIERQKKMKKHRKKARLPVVFKYNANDDAINVYMDEWDDNDRHVADYHQDNIKNRNAIGNRKDEVRADQRKLKLYSPLKVARYENDEVKYDVLYDDDIDSANATNVVQSNEDSDEGDNIDEYGEEGSNSSGDEEELFQEIHENFDHDSSGDFQPVGEFINFAIGNKTKANPERKSARKNYQILTHGGNMTQQHIDADTANPVSSTHVSLQGNDSKVMDVGIKRSDNIGFRSIDEGQSFFKAFPGIGESILDTDITDHAIEKGHKSFSDFSTNDESLFSSDVVDDDFGDLLGKNIVSAEPAVANTSNSRNTYKAATHKTVFDIHSAKNEENPKGYNQESTNQLPVTEAKDDEYLSNIDSSQSVPDKNSAKNSEGDVLPEYIKPAPPATGPNPYEVMTSDQLFPGKFTLSFKGT